MSRETIRFAIIGAGLISRIHARAIQRIDDAELIAVADPAVDKAGKLAEEFGIRHVYAAFEEMLKRDDIDVVTICLPSGLHADAAVAAAQAGKHILCEKPLDITVERMDRMIAAARKYNVKLASIFQHRTSPAALAVHQAIREHRLGKLVLGDVYMKYYRSPEYYRSSDWHGTWRLDGGGALMNQGVHGIDLIRWIVGDVESVMAYAAPLVRDIEVEDTAVAVLKYKNGAFGVIQSATSVYPGYEGRFEIHGDKGTIIFGSGGIREWRIEGSEDKGPLVEARLTGSSDARNISEAGHIHFFEDMIGAIRDNRDPMITGEEAGKSVKLVLAIHESARTRAEVKIS